MATEVRITMVDDIDGSEDNIKNVKFSLDGVNYEIDLSPSNATALREMFAPYIAQGRRIPKSSKKTAGSSKGAPAANTELDDRRSRNRRIREWARGRGYTLGERGRISAEIADAYDAAQAS